MLISFLCRLSSKNKIFSTERIEMQLNITEKETPGGNQEGTFQNYWANLPEQNTVSKKRVTYDDILSSLNMVVHNGVLQFANPTISPAPKQTLQSSHVNHSNNIKKVDTNHTKNQAFVPQDSYIHNKYFKDYLQQQQLQNEAPKPMTREEYIRDYNARVASARRIAQIKSKKLLFNTEHINVSPSSQVPPNMNRLFRSSFR